MAERGDFLGFTFAGIHSSTLNITRVSDGDRFDESLMPEVNDITVDVPGMDGEYFFGSTYGTRTFEIKIAYDSVTEEQFRKIRQLYGRKQIGELIFDERPYKKYLVKIESPIELSYVCFDEPKKQIVGTAAGDERYGVRWVEKTVSETVIDEETQEETTVNTTVRERERIYPYQKLSGTERIYKGEGTINFVAYYPFAKSVYKQLPSTEEESSWAISSGILKSSEYANFDIYNNETGVVNIYNAGDISTGFRLYFPSTATSNEITLIYKSNALLSQPAAILKLEPIVLKPNSKNGNQELIYDIGFIVDTNNGLILGVSDIGYDIAGNAIYTTSGNIYNEYVDSGYFFKLEPNFDKTDGATLQIEGGVEGIKIFYDYLYF